jgi:Sec-independent protein translocase protein TatA
MTPISQHAFMPPFGGTYARIELELQKEEGGVMDILGVGGWELVAIFLIMLVVAGPKRMISWSYTLGQYVAKLRKMWAETAKMLQKEFDDAGVDVKVPTDIPTRATLNQEIARALTPVTKPIQESMDAAKKEIDGAKKSVSFTTTPLTETRPPAEVKPTTPFTPPTLPPAETNASTTPPAPTPATPAAPSPSSNGHAADFGTWSQTKSDGT